MNLVSYLKDIYGYDNPIFIKDVRIGGRSKTAIREQFSRLVKDGVLSRDGQGIYSLAAPKDEIVDVVTFEKILEKKFIYGKDTPDEYKPLSINGYYSGLTFINMIGISEQVPATVEITTNYTNSKKSVFTALGRYAIIRKTKTDVDFTNYKYFQFLDMFHFLTIEEVIGNKELIVSYAKKIGFTKNAFQTFIKFYGPKTIKKIVEGGILNELIKR